MIGFDPSLVVAKEVAVALAGGPAAVARVRRAGRNSRVYRVRVGARTYALKQYPSPRHDDPRDRLSTEVAALRLMERHGIEMVPRVIAVDRDRGYALLSWLDGSPVVQIADADVDTAIAFLAAIHALRRRAEAADQPMAAEACLSGREIERQIEQRLARLRGCCEPEAELAAFLEHAFVPAWQRLAARARAHMDAAGLDFAADLPQQCRTLIPADFGFHNSLRGAGGLLAFVDFEYFGWDDPVKLTADMLLHPGMPLSLHQRDHFRRAAVQLYGEDMTFARRLDALVPLFGLRWALILLNEFIPERWSHRLVAGATETWDEARTRQLGRAREMLASLADQVEDYVDGET